MLLIVGRSAYSQPIYNSNPEVGQRLISRILDVNYITPTEMEAIGTDLNWNIVNADIIIQTPDTVWVVDMNQVPKKEFFPNGNIAFRFGSDSSAFFQIFRKSFDKLEQLGESDYNPDPPIKYNSPLTQYELPMMLGDEFEDTMSISIPTELGTVKAEVNVVGKAEAWGRLKTNRGTYDCVKLAYRSIVELFLGPLPIANQTQVEYRFYAPEYSSPIFVYTALEEEDPTGGITNDTVAYYVVNPPIAGISEKQKIQIGISPNPVRDLITVELDAAIGTPNRICIFNAEGIKVLDQKVQNSKETFSVSNWPSGKYMIQAVSEDKRWGMQVFSIIR